MEFTLHTELTVTVLEKSNANVIIYVCSVNFTVFLAFKLWKIYNVVYSAFWVRNFHRFLEESVIF
jgi:hypothetical protein